MDVHPPRKFKRIAMAWVRRHPWAAFGILLAGAILVRIAPRGNLAVSIPASPRGSPLDCRVRLFSPEERWRLLRAGEAARFPTWFQAEVAAYKLWCTPLGESGSAAEIEVENTSDEPISFYPSGGRHFGDAGVSIRDEAGRPLTFDNPATRSLKRLGRYYNLPDSHGLQVWKCRVSVRRSIRHPFSYHRRGCRNGRATEHPAGQS